MTNDKLGKMINQCLKKTTTHKTLHNSGQHFSWFSEEVSNEMQGKKENPIWWKKIVTYKSQC